MEVLSQPQVGQCPPVCSLQVLGVLVEDSIGVLQHLFVLVLIAECEASVSQQNDVSGEGWIVVVLQLLVLVQEGSLKELVNGLRYSLSLEELIALVLDFQEPLS